MVRCMMDGRDSKTSGDTSEEELCLETFRRLDKASATSEGRSQHSGVLALYDITHQKT